MVSSLGQESASCDVGLPPAWDWMREGRMSHRLSIWNLSRVCSTKHGSCVVRKCAWHPHPSSQPPSFSSSPFELHQSGFFFSREEQWRLQLTSVTSRKTTFSLFILLESPLQERKYQGITVFSTPHWLNSRLHTFHTRSLLFHLSFIEHSSSQEIRRRAKDTPAPLFLVFWSELMRPTAVVFTLANVLFGLLTT